MMVPLLLSVLFFIPGTVFSEKCACLHWTHVKEERCMELTFFQDLMKNVSIDTLEINSITIEKREVCNNLTEENRGGWGFSIDVTHNSDGSNSYGGSLSTPLGGVSGHVHTDSSGKVSGGDGGLSVGSGLVSGGLHGSYDKGTGGSVGVHASVGLPHLSAGVSVDVDSHKTASVSGSGTVGSSTFGGSINTKGETSASVGNTIPLGKRDDMDFDIADLEDEETSIVSEELNVVETKPYPVVDSDYRFY